ncbi:MAG: hypothetical protein EYC70_06935 [Planctomycetota bacterium]|nr:MAG: hypothetical protein EYC70_06935 [Planctomycetota bacterium]
MFLTAAAVAQEPEDVYENATFAFRVRAPGPGWALLPNEGGESVTLTVYRPESGGTVGATVRVAWRLEEGDAEALLADARARAEENAALEGLEECSDRVGGRETPGLTVLYTPPNAPRLRVRQYYVVAAGAQYVLECHAPVEEYERHEPDFRRFLGSFELLPRTDEMEEERDLAALAGRCGSEVAWAQSWEEAAERARAEGKLIAVTAWMYPGFDLSDEIRSGPFMDLRVLGAVRTRCVPWRFRRGEAPFEGQDSYGMGPNTFGAALLLVSPEGQVVAETAAVEPNAVYEFLRETLARHPEYPGAGVPAQGDALERAAAHLQRGEHEAAEALLQGDSSGQARRLRADLLRRRRDGAGALAELALAREGADPASAAELDLEEAELRIALGQAKEAGRLLRRLAERGGAEDAAAGYWLGAQAWEREDQEEAERRWRGVIREHPDSRWAWLAAAELRSTAFGLTPDGPDLRWPAPPRLAALRVPEGQPAAGAPLEEVESAAVAWLLAAQQPDGSWISPTELSTAPYEATDSIKDAISALCGMALLAQDGREECRKAAENALAYLMAARLRSRLKPQSAPFMDYSVWSLPFQLWFCADALDAKLGSRARLAKVAADILDELERKQMPGGGWSYFRSTNPAAGDAPATLSTSFVTAAEVLALVRARQAGIAPPARMLEAALDCLERMREEPGSYAYMLDTGQLAGQRAVFNAEAAGRGPLIELALLRGGRGSVERVRAALERFGEHAAVFDRQRGKALMHAGPEGQGCHYLLFDYAFAAAAAAELPEAEREPHRARLRGLVLACRSAEGAFRDTPITGWAYGTAMALRALADLAPPR